MNTLSIPAVVMAGLTIYVGFYHLLIYSRRRQHREDLTFALTALMVGFYAIASAGLYNAPSVVEGARWQRMQLFSLNWLSIAFLWFVRDYTGQGSKKVTMLLTILSLISAVVQLTVWNDLTWIMSQPSIKNITLPFNLQITYNEVTPGPLTNLQSLLGLTICTFVLWSAARQYRSGRRKEAVPLLMAEAIFVIGIINDTAVSVGMYQFVYTIEYAYIAMIFLMAYSLSNAVVEAAIMKEVLQKTNDALTIATATAQEANRLKDLFLATMSHELRTPLNAIIGFLGLMSYSGQLDEDNSHMADRARANSERLLGLINNILDLSRIASGRLEITPVVMSLRDLVETVHKDMELRLKEKALAFYSEVDPALPDQIVHDQERIIQIITNLLGNAIKFTDQGEVRLRLHRNDDRLVIEVSDTGIGIPIAKQDIIFDEFTQIDSGSTRQYGGSGLGLSIVKRLTMLMHGSVKVYSEAGGGSTFTVDLPLSLASLTTPHTVVTEEVLANA